MSAVRCLLDDSLATTHGGGDQLAVVGESVLPERSARVVVN